MRSCIERGPGYVWIDDGCIKSDGVWRSACRSKSDGLSVEKCRDIFVSYTM